MRLTRGFGGLALLAFGLWGCAVQVEGDPSDTTVDAGEVVEETPPNPTAPGATGGTAPTSTGGAPASGGTSTSGGTGAVANPATGGTPADGGAAPSTGGVDGTGGTGSVTGTGGTGSVMGTGGTATDPLFPEPVDVTTLPPSPNNPPECPDVAPENPVGDCLGLPVYLSCSWSNGTRTYSCVCDWYHWLCL